MTVRPFVNGNCVDMPTEPDDRGYQNRVKIRSYPVREANGLIWAYMGRREHEPPFPAFAFTKLIGQTGDIPYELVASEQRVILIDQPWQTVGAHARKETIPSWVVAARVPRRGGRSSNQIAIDMRSAAHTMKG